jgi:hypothetical protein
MPLPLVGLGLAAVASYLAKNGTTQAVKKYGSKAIKAVRDAERGVASRAGSKEGLEVIPKTAGQPRRLKQSNPDMSMAPKGARIRYVKPTAAQTAKNIRSGRQRYGAGLIAAGAGAGYSLGGSEGDKWDEDEAGRTKTTTPKATAPKTTTPTGTSKATPTTPKVEYKSSFPKAEKKNWEDYNSIAEAKKAGSLYYSKGKGADKERMAAVFKEDLTEEDLATKNPLRNYMNRQIKKDKARDAARGGIANMGPPMEVTLEDGMKAGMKAGGKVRGMNYGGKVRGMNYGGKVEGMKSGGKVRGAGIARKGTRACKIR